MNTVSSSAPEGEDMSSICIHFFALISLNMRTLWSYDQCVTVPALHIHHNVFSSAASSFSFSDEL